MLCRYFVILAFIILNYFSLAEEVWGDSGEKFFFVSKKLQKRVHFWERVFTHYNSSSFIIHDQKYPEKIRARLGWGEPRPGHVQHGGLETTAVGEWGTGGVGS